MRLFIDIEIISCKFQEVQRLVQRKVRKANRAPLSFLIGWSGIIGLKVTQLYP